MSWLEQGKQVELFELEILRKLFITLEKIGIADGEDLCRLDREIVLKEFHSESQKMIINDILDRLKK